MTTDRPDRAGRGRRRPPTAAGALMVFAAAAFAVASTVHFGVDIPLGFTTVSDTFTGAATPEALIAAVVAVGAVAVLTRRTRGRAIALGTTSFAILGTVYGLTITLNSTRTGDVVYHFSVLATLLVILGLLLVPGRPGARPAPYAGSGVTKV